MLYRIQQLEWAQRRDFFPAQLIAIQASSEKQTFSAEDILRFRYERLPESTAEQMDPDLGAGGDWRALRAGLKGSDGTPTR